jgi:hypothetical protein
MEARAGISAPGSLSFLSLRSLLTVPFHCQVSFCHHVTAPPLLPAEVGTILNAFEVNPTQDAKQSHDGVLNDPMQLQSRPCCWSRCSFLSGSSLEYSMSLHRDSPVVQCSRSISPMPHSFMLPDFGHFEYSLHHFPMFLSYSLIWHITQDTTYLSRS